MQKKICFLHMELSHREIPSLQKEFKDEAERRAYENIRGISPPAEQKSRKKN